MRWVVAAAVVAVAVAGCGGTTKTVIQSAAPTQTVTRTVVKHAPARPAHTTSVNAPTSSAPQTQSATPAITNGVAVVTQYYQDITDSNYSAAWALGGKNIAALNGQTYNSWVAGYGTTAHINVTSSGGWDANRVWCDISATQDSGAVYDYYGTYDVAGGVIVSAHIRQLG